VQSKVKCLNQLGTDSERVSAPVSGLENKCAAVVVFSYYPSDTRVMRAARAMVKAGMQVQLLCLRQHPAEPCREQLDGVEIERVRIKKRRSGKVAYIFQYLVFFLHSLCWVSWRHLIRRYDVIHVHNMPDFLVFCAAFAKRLGARVVLDLHDPSPEVFRSIYGLDQGDWIVRQLLRVERLSIWFADMVLTPNITFQSLFAARSCARSKVEIVMNSPLDEVFPLREPPDGEMGESRKLGHFFVMFHGTLVKRHGLHTAVEAMARLKGRIPGLCFHVYGEQTEYVLNEILPLVEKLGMADQVKFFGEQPQEVIAEAVGHCDLGLVPNLRNVFTELNFPTRIFEYLALGKPVIVPDTLGIKDYYGVGDILFFEPGSIESLASQIEWAFNHPAELAGLVRRGQTVYRRHLWKLEEEKFLRLITRLVT
jgi:glycosyltransferase involved in cell wall biosynthesis